MVVEQTVWLHFLGAPLLSLPQGARECVKVRERARGAREGERCERVQEVREGGAREYKVT